MKFLLSHPLLVFSSVPLGFAFYYFLKGIIDRESVAECVSSPQAQNLWVGFNALFLAFVLVWGYGHGSAYYHPVYDGAVGDNYHYLADVLEDPSYFNAQHVVYPAIPGLWIRFLTKTGLLSLVDPDFFEKAFSFSVQPVRCFELICLIYILWAFRRKRMSWAESLQATLLVSLSAAFWVWAHQSNAMGFALSLELVAAVLLWIWMDDQRWWQLFGLALALGLCVFAQAATIYFVATLFLFVTIYLLRFSNRRSRAKDWIIFTGTLLVLGAIYYEFAASWSKSYNPVDIFHHVADTRFLGAYKVSVQSLPKALKDNVVNCVVAVFNIWDPKSKFDFSMIFMELILVWALLCVVVGEARQNIQLLLKQEHVAFVSCSVVIFVAFLVRDSGSRYFATIAVPNVMLLIVVLVKEATLVKKVLLQLLLVSMFLFSGFSSLNVFETANVEGSICYRLNQTIVSRLTSGQKASYFGYYDLKTKASDGNVYRDEAIKNYYGKKFNRIQWIWDRRQWGDPQWLNGQILKFLASGVPVYLSDDALDVLHSHTSRAEILAIQPNLHQVLAIRY